MNSPRISGRAQLFIVLLILSQALMSLGQDFLTNGLVAYYPFNGNANDKSGNGNHGLVQGATLTTDRHSVPGRAYYFDGVDDIILATVPFLPIGGQPRTVSLWAKAAPDVFCGTTLVQWGTPDYNQAFTMNANGAPCTWRAGTLGGGTEADSGLIIDRGWHHLVGTYDGTIRVFVDGTLKGQLGIGTATRLSPLHIGANIETNAQGGHLQSFAGTLDQIRIYNRALSSSEIAALHSYESTNINLSTNGLVAYYPFNGNANDESGNGNHGLVQGATLTTDRNGAAGTAYYFDGISNLITSNIGNLPLGNEPRTISLWAKAAPDVVCGTTLAQWGYPDNGRAFGIIANAAPCTWWAASWGGGNDADSGVPIDEQWHHLVGTYDGTLRIFVDGSLKGELAIGIVTGPSQLHLGVNVETNAQGGHMQMFKGALDEIRIYNRSLSGSEVLQLYQIEKFPELRIRKAVSLEFSNLQLGSNYQLQISPALNVWTNTGVPFPATNTIIRSTQYWDVGDWNERFFRLQLVP